MPTKDRRSDSDPRDPFSTAHLEADLKSRTVRGSAATLSSQMFLYFVNFGSLAVLARLLTPEDFGVIAMVSAIVGFVAVFRDAGLSMATVQRRSVNHEQVSALFWINVFVSTGLAAAIAAASPAVAWFYDEPRLSLVTAALGLGFLTGGFGVQHRALLRRQMRFRTLAAVEVLAQVTGQIAAIVAAFAGWSYWALVLRAVLTPTFLSILCWATVRWRPGLPSLTHGVRSMLAFGGYLTAFNTVNYLGRNADNVLIGKFVGSAELGIYSKAYSLLLLPLRMVNGPLSAATTPALARLQDQPEKLRDFYYKGVALAAMLSMPVVTAAAATADSVILTVLGEKWSEAIGIFRILAIAAFIGTSNVVTGWVYLSLGNVKRQFISGVANTLIGILAFAIGIQWGLVGVAWALAISAVVRRPPTILYCYWGTPFSMLELLKTQWRPAFASIIAGLVTFFVHSQVAQTMPPPLALLSSAPVFLFSYVAAFLVQPGGKSEIMRAIRAVRLLRLRKPSRQNASTRPVDEQV